MIPWMWCDTMDVVWCFVTDAGILSDTGLLSFITRFISSSSIFGITIKFILVIICHKGLVCVVI